MELNKGFKQTDIGWIPEDWEVKKLSDLTSMVTNGFVGTVKSQYTDSGDGITYIQGYNVEENSFNFRGIKKVTPEFHKQHQKSCLMEGDLLTIQTGDVGLTTIVPKELVGANCHALIITRFKKNTSNPRFYSCLFNSKIGRARLKEIETGTTMKHINVGDLLHFLVPTPPLPEQTAIATALSDTDALLSSLDTLLTKKRNIKQAAMQRLLEPGEGWVVRKLGEVVEISKGQMITNSIRINGDIPVIAGGKTPAYYHNKPNRTGKTISISGSGASAGYISYHDYPIFASDCSTISEAKHYSIEFIYSFLKSNQERIYKMQTGGAQPHIHPRDLKPIEICLPPLNEQTRIATILTDLDRDIEALEKKIAKYKAIKTGMMQNLLTGKIRLT
jgi:type I restriction enzyme S subunit